jgi:hypothetical protein
VYWVRVEVIMVVLKSTYKKLFDLFIREKQGALELYKEKTAILKKNQELLNELCALKRKIANIKEQLRKLGE